MARGAIPEGIRRQIHECDFDAVGALHKAAIRSGDFAQIDLKTVANAMGYMRLHGRDTAKIVETLGVPRSYAGLALMFFSLTPQARGAFEAYFKRTGIIPVHELRFVARSPRDLQAQRALNIVAQFRGRPRKAQMASMVE